MAEFNVTDADHHVDEAELSREASGADHGSIKISAGGGRNVFFYVSLAIRVLGHRDNLTITGIGKGSPLRPSLGLEFTAFNVFISFELSFFFFSCSSSIMRPSSPPRSLPLSPLASAFTAPL